MTHTAEPMTLASVHDEMVLVYGQQPGRVQAWIEGIDAELAKQREAEPVGCIHPDTLAAMQTDSRMERCALRRWTEVTKLDGHVPLYNHPQQRNAVEVTKEEVTQLTRSFVTILRDKDGLNEVGKAHKLAQHVKRNLSAVASRDGDDAEIGRYLIKNSEWIRDENGTLIALRLIGKPDLSCAA